MVTSEQTAEIACLVRDAIASVPPFDDMTLTVVEKSIRKEEMRVETVDSTYEQIWWRVPIIPHPVPRRLSPFYDALSEIEEYLEDERGVQNIDLISGDFEEPEEPDETAQSNASAKRELTGNETASDIAELVCAALAKTTPPDGMTLSVNEQEIKGLDAISGMCWMVTIVAVPEPARASKLDKTFEKIQGELREKYGLDINLFL